MNNDQRIGVFDSGIGGLSVVKSLVQQLPHLSIAYFADTARMPYGEKSVETIAHYTTASANFLASQQVSLLALACHTASAYAAAPIRATLAIPAIDILSVAIETVSRNSLSGRIAILATRATLRSGAYQNLLLAKRPDAQLFPLACPLFAPLVEEGFANHPTAQRLAAEYLQPLRSARVDTVLLACTHYPFLRKAIETHLPEGACLIDPALDCAHAISLQIPSRQSSFTTPRYDFFVSDNPARFARIASQTLPDLPLRVAPDPVDLHDYVRQ